MSMIQIRNVPEDVHRTLKARAAAAGMSLSEYLGKELAWVARRPTASEIVARIRERTPPRADIDAAAYVREERERGG